MKTNTSHVHSDFIVAVLTSLLQDGMEILLKQDFHTVVDIATLNSFIKTDIAMISSACLDDVSALRFMTVVLPQFGKSVDKMLATDSPFYEGIYTEFTQLEIKELREDGEPYGFMSWAIHAITGDDHCPNGQWPSVVQLLRQVSYLGYKLKLPYTNDQLRKAADTFVSNDAEVVLIRPPVRDAEGRRCASIPYSPSLCCDSILQEAINITSYVFRKFEPWDIVPRHGPGSVSTGERGVQKLTVGQYRKYPIYDTYDVTYFACLPNTIFGTAALEQRERELLEPTTKVVFVPKDSRGPRVISCEPLEYQWIQQGLGRAIMAHLESHVFTKNRINFADQSVNGALALASSLSRKFVTLDLKDASDFVSYSLVEHLFSGVPNLWRCLDAARSTKAVLPDGRTVNFRKFAPMGSALCFPVESFVFWVLSIAALRVSTKETVKSLGKHVYVYGDDIAVESTYHRLVAATLSEFGLKLNREKCCFGRFFRESCGIDAYSGVNVSPARWQTPLPRSSHDVASCFSLAALSNALYERGYERTADLFARRLFQIEPLTMKVKTPYSGLLQICRPYHGDHFDLPRKRRRFNKHLQRYEVLGVVALPYTYSYSGGGWAQVSDAIIRNSSRTPCEFEKLARCATAHGTVTSYTIVKRVRRNLAWRPIY